MSHDQKVLQDRARADPGLLEKVATKVDHIEEITSDAAGAAEAEKEMTMMEAFKAYPKAVAWHTSEMRRSMLFSTAIVMEGFDLTMINAFYALPVQRKFGELAPNGVDYLITPAWQTGLSNGVQVGQILGLMINGWACDRFGYKKTIGASLFLVTCFIFITFFAINLPMLLVGEMLCGLPWGVFQTLSVSYAAEVCPIALRHYLTTYVNLCWVMGQFISSGVLKGVSTLPETSQWAYKIPFALQWIWPVPILIGCYFAPESPWWLVRQGRLEEAKFTLNRLGSPVAGSNAPAIDVDKRVAQMIHTNEMEKVIHEGTSYLDCLKGSNRRRTEIAAMTWMIQTLSGSGFIGYSTVFFTEAGFSTDEAFSLSLGIYAIGAVGTISSWYTINKFGRRPIYLYGLFSMTFTLLAVGITGFFDVRAATQAAGALTMIYGFLYQFTVGPACYCIVAEIPSTRLRAKTVVLARNAYNIVGIISNILFPRMLSPIAWNWGRKSGFFWAGSNILCVIYVYFRLPETRGRTYAELDVLFDDGVSARKFKKTKVDMFAAEARRNPDDDLLQGHGGGMH